MINFDGKEMREEFNRVFNDLSIAANPNAPILEQHTRRFTIDDLSAEQLWWLVKFAKHIRGRCRSNAALNNYLNRNFNARFIEVDKQTKDGKTYKGLKITVGDSSYSGEGDTEE